LLLNMLVLILAALVASSFAAPTSFFGEQIVSVNITTQTDVKKLWNLLGPEVDVWSHDSILALGDNHIRVNSTIRQAIVAAGFQVKTVIADLQKIVEEELAGQLEANLNQSDFFTSYHSYAEIRTFVQQLASSSPLVTYIPSIGKSIEGRDIAAIRIFGGGQTTDSTPRVWFQGGQHAREWIAPATVLYIVNQLVQDYATNPNVKDLLNNIEFVIVPLCNPDGYEFARASNRLWRKNRRPVPPYYGVDLNRNWDVYWGKGEGSSPFPGSDVYRGTGPFSEPESAAISSLLKSLPNVIGAIDWHSYSQLILRPYGWTYQTCPQEKELSAMGTAWSAVIRSVSGIYYTSQTSSDLYLTDGAASDWFYEIGVVPAFTIELRDTGQYGFVLPPAQIKPTGAENYQGVLYYVTSIYQLFLQKKI